MAQDHWITASRAPLLAVAALLAAAAPAGYGSLGGSVDAVGPERAQIAGTARAGPPPAYTMHEMQAPGDTIVREYTTGGTVFAVTWRGSTRPDLRQLLGPYFADFQEAARDARAGRGVRGPLVLHRPGLVIESGGHMRAFFGRAYLPAQVPAGVNVQALP